MWSTEGEQWSTTRPIFSTLRSLALGLLLGLGPMLLVLFGLFTFFVPGPGGGSMWGGWATCGAGVCALALAVVDVLALVPLLWMPTTRTLGLGLAVGFAISCGVLAYYFTHIDLSSFFY